MEENKNEEVYLIAGVINTTGKVLYWRDEKYMYVGNYAIVENISGYDLVKIIGRVKTTKKEASKFSNTKYENMKKNNKRNRFKRFTTGIKLFCLIP